nr:immunoglobulin light chain junction region [Macaca mulatta]
CQQYNNRNSF